MWRNGSLQVGRIAGIPIGLHWTWFIIAVILAQSLAMGYFPQQFENLSTSTAWILGITAALGLFASILLHELGHALMARRDGLEMRSITLFIFGGIASMPEEPKKPGIEFRVAVAGPLVSIALAVIAWVLQAAFASGGAVIGFGGGDGSRLDLTASVFGYLAMINTILVIFNAIPAFPLDGGRVLRSIVWKVSGNFVKATRITAGLGSGFGLVLIGMGVLALFGMLPGSGIWSILIGLFLFMAARGSYQQVVVQSTLSGQTVDAFVSESANPVTVDLDLRSAYERIFSRHDQKVFPVVDGGRLVGVVHIDAIDNVDEDRWSSTTIRDIMDQPDDAEIIASSAEADEAMEHMQRAGSPRLLVVDDGHLRGIVRQEDLITYVGRKVQMRGRAA